MSVISRHPNVYPAFGSVGISEEFIVECVENLSSSGIITLDVVEEKSMILIQKVSATSIGPKALKVNMPEFNKAGNYAITIKFDNQVKPEFPVFVLPVLSPLEIICLKSQRVTGDKSPVLAAALAYLIQCEKLGLEDHLSPDQKDDIFSNMLFGMQKIEVPMLSLLAFLSGKYYVGNEGLLHFLIRHKMESSCQYLLQPDVAGHLKGILQLEGFDRKTPQELAKQYDMKDLSIIIDDISRLDGKSSNACSPAPVIASNKTNIHKNSKTDERRSTQPKKLLNLSKKHIGRIKTAIKKRKHVDSIESEQHSFKNDKQTAPISRESSPYLYIARATVDYECVSSTYGTAVLKAGDIVHVISEDDNGMCFGILHNEKKEFPISCLNRLPHFEITQNPSGNSEKKTAEGHEYEDIEYYAGDSDTYLDIEDEIPTSSVCTNPQPCPSSNATKNHLRSQLFVELANSDDYYVGEVLPLRAAKPKDSSDDDDDGYEEFCPEVGLVLQEVALPDQQPRSQHSHHYLDIVDCSPKLPEPPIGTSEQGHHDQSNHTPEKALLPTNCQVHASTIGVEHSAGIKKRLPLIPPLPNSPKPSSCPTSPKQIPVTPKPLPQLPPRDCLRSSVEIPKYINVIDPLNKSSLQSKSSDSILDKVNKKQSEDSPEVAQPLLKEQVPLLQCHVTNHPQKPPKPISPTSSKSSPEVSPQLQTSFNHSKYINIAGVQHDPSTRTSPNSVTNQLHRQKSPEDIPEQSQPAPKELSLSHNKTRPPVSQKPLSCPTTPKPILRPKPSHTLL